LCVTRGNAIFRRRPPAAASARSFATRFYLSHVCPLKYDLLFERFLDENRREAT
jgi:DNA polymerase III alpha subunit